jgi:hypothetical protein
MEAGDMKHRSSQTLFDHWSERRGERPLPERGEIDPGAIRGALGDTFVLAFSPLDEHPFRLAGTRICSLLGRELKGTSFNRLWARPIAGIADLVRVAADESVGVVAGASGRTADGDALDLELLLLPLRHWGRTHVRLIGTLAPLRNPYWAGAKPLGPLTLGEHRYVGGTMPGWNIAAGASDNVVRLRRKMIVHQGGQP